jgi:hypothetical protein
MCECVKVCLSNTQSIGVGPGFTARAASKSAVAPIVACVRVVALTFTHATPARVVCVYMKVIRSTSVTRTHRGAAPPTHRNSDVRKAWRKDQGAVTKSTRR